MCKVEDKEGVNSVLASLKARRVRRVADSLVQILAKFDQKCLLTDSLHRLGSRFARTSSVPLEIKDDECISSI